MNSVLDALGPIPKPLITLDFESFYSKDFTIRKLTTEGYVRDSRFEVIGVGVKVGARPSVWMEEQDFRAWTRSVPWQRVRVLAQHAHFEGLVLSHHYNVRPGFWIDTLSMSRALHGPGGPGGEGNDLGNLAKHYEVGAKGEDLKWTKGKRRCDFTPQEWLTFGEYCRNDDELTFGIAAQMVPTFPVAELWLIDATVRMFTEPTFRGNVTVLDAATEDERKRKREAMASVARAAGVEIPGHLLESTDDATIHELAPLLERVRAQLASSDLFAALLQARGIEAPTKQGKNGTIYAFAKNDPGMQALLAHEDPEIRTLAETRLAVKSTIVETRTERFAQMARRGSMPVYLNYAKAHTHRWSGGDGSNWQNMNRGGVLRDAVEAPGGRQLAVADSGQIEARVVAWLAGEDRLLETFRRNDASKDGDFYSDVGSQFFGKRLSKKDTPIERQVSKNMVLGLGFGMGWAKFSGELLKGMLGAPPVQFTNEHARQYGVDVFGFEQRPWNKATCGDVVHGLVASGVRLPYGELLVHCAVADHFVRLYRSTNPRIVAYWKTMDAVIQMMAEPGDPDVVRAKIGPLEVMHQAIRKPSGLVLHYPRLTRSGTEWRYWGYKDGRMQWCKIYGGLLTENVVQSIARDIVAEQALWIRAAGWPPVTLTHDEVVTAPLEADAERCLGVMLAAMKRPPEWAAGLPLNASGAIGRTYGSAK